MTDPGRPRPGPGPGPALIGSSDGLQPQWPPLTQPGRAAALSVRDDGSLRAGRAAAGPGGPSEAADGRSDRTPPGPCSVRTVLLSLPLRQSLLSSSHGVI
eukprot:756811-Hanusia_phi.AAC.2